MRTTAWGFALFFFAVFLVAAYAGSIKAASIFFLLSLVSLCLLLFYGRLEIDNVGVKRYSPLGTHQILWEQVKRVETDGMTFVLCGSDKRFPLWPFNWQKSDREIAAAFVTDQLERHAVPTVISRSASYRLPKNVRVPAT